jgi:hypothetical protein
MIQKRFEYWGTQDGKPVKKWSPWFNYHGSQEKYQLDKKLRNEYREV